MNVIIACEYSGIVSAAFRKKGHEAFSCDILPTDGDANYHIIGDALNIIKGGTFTTQSGRVVTIKRWNLIIAHPPCTYLTNSAEWAYKDKQTKKMKPGTLIGAERRAAREEAIKFFMAFINADADMIAVENPIGVMSSRYREPDQYIQPNEYGHDASKETCLWLKNLPTLVPTGFYPPRLVLHPNGKRYVYRWSNQTDSGQNKLPPSETRGHDRSKTYQGWADAMADQWGTATTLQDMM